MAEIIEMGELLSKRYVKLIKEVGIIEAFVHMTGKQMIMMEKWAAKQPLNCVNERRRRPESSTPLI